MSRRHVAAIDPLVDSIPKLTIDGRATALLHFHKANNMRTVSSTCQNNLETKYIVNSEFKIMRKLYNMETDLTA